jgi:hypothetical protein
MQKRQSPALNNAILMRMISCYSLIKRIGQNRAYAPSCIFQCSQKVTEERSAITIRANALLDLSSDFWFIAPPTGQKPIAIDPVINCESKEFHEFLLCGFISTLCQADRRNADDISGVPIGWFLRRDKDMQSGTMFLVTLAKLATDA